MLGQEQPHCISRLAYKPSDHRNSQKSHPVAGKDPCNHLTNIVSNEHWLEGRGCDKVCLILNFIRSCACWTWKWEALRKYSVSLCVRLSVLLSVLLYVSPFVSVGLSICLPSCVSLFFRLCPLPSNYLHWLLACQCSASVCLSGLCLCVCVWSAWLPARARVSHSISAIVALSFCVCVHLPPGVSNSPRLCASTNLVLSPISLKPKTPERAWIRWDDILIVPSETVNTTMRKKNNHLKQ